MSTDQTLELELIKLKFDEVRKVMIERQKKMRTEMEKLVSECESLKKAVVSVEMEEEIHRLRLQILQLEEKLHTSETKYEQLQRGNKELRVKKGMEPRVHLEVDVEAMDNSAEEEEGEKEKEEEEQEDDNDEEENGNLTDIVESAEKGSTSLLPSDNQGKEPKIRGSDASAMRLDGEVAAAEDRVVISLSDSDDETPCFRRRSKRKIRDEDSVGDWKKRSKAASAPSPSPAAKSLDSSAYDMDASDDEWYTDSYLKKLAAELLSKTKKEKKMDG